MTTMNNACAALCIVAGVGAAAATFAGGVVPAVWGVSDDRSFYHAPDKNDWPGDRLSLRQYERAVEHFADPAVCSHSWRWALIGPGTFLLKGTRYQVIDSYEAPLSNVHAIKGYWGDGFAMDSLTRSIPFVKSRAEEAAGKDCKYGIKP